LRGAEPADRPVRSQIKYELHLDCKSAEVPGPTFPLSPRRRGDRVRGKTRSGLFALLINERGDRHVSSWRVAKIQHGYRQGDR
jgi:hypothetical protein